MNSQAHPHAQSCDARVQKCGRMYTPLYILNAPIVSPLSLVHHAVTLWLSPLPASLRVCPSASPTAPLTLSHSRSLSRATFARTVNIHKHTCMHATNTRTLSTSIRSTTHMNTSASAGVHMPFRRFFRGKVVVHASRCSPLSSFRYAGWRFWCSFVWCTFVLTFAPICKHGRVARRGALHHSCAFLPQAICNLNT